MRPHTATERAAQVVLTKVTELRDTKTPGKSLLDPATPGQPQTNGVAENAVQDITTQVRKYKIALETRLGIPIPARSVIFKWLVRHAADTINRSLTGHDGKVPLQRLLNKMPQPLTLSLEKKCSPKSQTASTRGSVHFKNELWKGHG